MSRWIGFLFIFISAIAPSVGVTQDDISPDIYHQRNLGRAYFEEDRLEEAIAAFERCVALAPDSAVEQVNLGIAYLQAKRYEDAARALDRAEALGVKGPHDASVLPYVYYNRALLYKRQAQFEKVAEQFEKVKALDPTSGDTRYNLGLTYLRLRQPEKAAAEFAACVKLLPNHVSAHYHLYRHAARTKQQALADKELETFQRLKETIPESQRTEIALERSVYTEIILPPPTQQTPNGIRSETSDIPAVTFVDVTKMAGLPAPLKSPAGAADAFHSVFPASQYTEAFAQTDIVPNLAGDVVFLDFDNDDHLDIYLVRGSAVEEDSTNRLYRNNGDGTFTDATEMAGVGDAGMGFSAVAGDYDNDGDLDIYVANDGPNLLYRNNGDGTFTDVTGEAGVGHTGWSRAAIFVDYDHEGDLDLYVANYVDLTQTPVVRGQTIRFPEDFVGSENVLYRNNGDGTFTDVTASAEVGGGAGKSIAVFSSDFDDDNDIDLCVANADGQSYLYLNLRDGKFGESASRWGLQPDFQPLAAGDVNNDERMDIGLNMAGVLSVATNPDNAHFDGFRPLLGEAAAPDGVRPYFVDYNNDGRLDLLGLGGRGGLFRNDGTTGWTEVAAETFENLGLSDGRRAAFGDYDNDGDADFLLLRRAGTLTLLRNDGGNANHWVKVRATGVKMNRSGIGSKVEVRAGAFYFKTEIDTPPLLIGLGAHNRLDAIRIKWPNGIAQNEIDVRANQTVTITEKKGIPSSCPFVYVWDGQRYRFVKDILDVGALGVRLNLDDFLPPDHDEMIKLDTVKPVPKDGVYSIQLTEELQELVYLDEVKFYVVDHPADIFVYHNDKFTLPPFPEFAFHAVKNPIYPTSAEDHHRNDITPLVTARDRKYAERFGLLPYTGLTEMHAITLDFGDLSKADKILLFLNGWINWGDSTTNVAVAQNAHVASILPYLQVKDAQGQWQTVINPMGFPAGWGKTVAIDLTNRFLSTDYHVRIVTNMEIYWDEIFVGTEFHPDRLTTTTLLPKSADLRYYGYATPYSPDGEEPMLYDYDRVQLTSPWSPHAGRLTRYGDVTALLSCADDKYVIMAPGDEVHLAFDPKTVPPLPEGWVRDYFLYADGWIKDGDLNTAFSATVKPLPFHGMSGYPYAAAESYPFDSEHLDYLRTYNTRDSGLRKK